MPIVPSTLYVETRFDFKFIAETLQTTCAAQIYADLPGFRAPSIISGDTYRPDLLLLTPDDKLYIVELTVGFETNLHNVERKKAKYEDFIKEMKDNFVSVKFVNLSISCLGVFHKECRTFLEMLDTLGLDKNYQRYCIKKIMSYAIRGTYNIFCCRNKERAEPKLLKY